MYWKLTDKQQDRYKWTGTYRESRIWMDHLIDMDELRDMKRCLGINSITEWEGTTQHHWLNNEKSQDWNSSAPEKHNIVYNRIKVIY